MNKNRFRITDEKKFEGDFYVSYENLEHVWFKATLIPYVSEQFLLNLSMILKSEDNDGTDNRILNEYCSNGYLVQGTDIPIRCSPLGTWIIVNRKTIS